MKMKTSSMANWLFRGVFLLLTVSVFVSIFFPRLFPFSQEDASAWITSSPNDRLLFVGVQILQVLVPPISHYFTSMLGGYIYGPILGGTLNFVGRLIGQFVAYGLAIFAANRMAKRKSTTLERFGDLVRGDKRKRPIRALIIFSMIALPFFPDDELSYAMGFVKFPFRLFALVTVAGHALGSYALAYLGSGEEFRGPLFVGLASFTVICFVGLAWGSIRYRKFDQGKIVDEDN